MPPLKPSKLARYHFVKRQSPAIKLVLEKKSTDAIAKATGLKPKQVEAIRIAISAHKMGPKNFKSVTRDVRIIDLLAKGKTRDEIETTMKIPRTYVDQILNSHAKLGVKGIKLSKSTSNILENKKIIELLKNGKTIEEILIDFPHKTEIGLKTLIQRSKKKGTMPQVTEPENLFNRAVRILENGGRVKELVDELDIPRERAFSLVRAVEYKFGTKEELAEFLAAQKRNKSAAPKKLSNSEIEARKRPKFKKQATPVWRIRRELTDLIKSNSRASTVFGNVDPQKNAVDYLKKRINPKTKLPGQISGIAQRLANTRNMQYSIAQGIISKAASIMIMQKKK